MKCIIIISLISLISFKSFADGAKIYKTNCSSCHHDERIGKSGPPLLAELIDKIPDEKLGKIIKNGLPNTMMPAHPQLSDNEITEVVSFLRTKSSVSWSPKDIKKSIEIGRDPIKK